MRNPTDFPHHFKYSIARRLIACIFLFSALLIFLSTCWIMYRDYRKDLSQIEDRIQMIAESHLKGITRSLWEIDENLLKIQMEGVLRLPDMQYLAIEQPDGRRIDLGNPKIEGGVRRQFPLLYGTGGKTYDLGMLLVVAGMDGVYHRLIDRAVITLLTQTIIIVMVSMFVFFLFYFLVGRHLHAIAVYAGSLNMHSPDAPLKLKRGLKKHAGRDELEQVVSAINDMHSNLKDLYRSLEKNIDELKINVAEHKRAEVSLRESEERYRLLAEQSIQGIAVLRGIQTSIVYVNPAWTRIFGYTAPEALSLTTEQIWNLVHPDDRAFVRQRNQARMQGKPAEQRYEFRIVRKDGAKRWVEVFANSTEFDAQPASQALYIDITDRKRSEEERLGLATAIESAADAIILTDKRGVIEYVNPATEKATGMGRDELVGHNFAVLRSDQHDNAFYKSMWITISSGDVWSGHIVNRIKDGSLCEFETKISPVKDTFGNIMRYVSVNRDVTQEIQMEKQIRQAQKMEAIGTLAGGIAHDFNNILAAILGYTELTRSTIAQGTAEYRYLEQVIKASSRARDLVQQILLFSRQGSDELKPVHVGSIIREALQLLRATLPSTIDIRQKLSSSSDSKILADPTQIHQVLMNLGTNAAHAMREKGGVLEVSLSDLDPEMAARSLPELESGAYILLTVSDTGHGMDRRVMDRIFDPFFTTKKSGEGTGMGLSVVHGIVKRHNGILRVFSEPDKGTVFHLFFPRVKDTKTEAIENLSIVSRGRGRILFVDDEKTLVELVQQILEYLGYEVIARTSAMEALALFRSQPDHFDLVITDYTMPHMTGISLSREILTLRPDMPVILCTGYNEMITEENARSIGIREFIMKPVTINELSNKVAAALDRGHSAVGDV
jgi:PAS domain S-box-containing protein